MDASTTRLPTRPERSARSARSDRAAAAPSREGPRYQRQESPQTLREALAEYDACEPDLVGAGDLDRATGREVRAHDAQHVVFGCDTSVRGEFLLTRWSVFGATDWVPFYVTGLRYPETRWLVLDFFRRSRGWRILAAAPASLVCLWRSLFMARRWPSEDWARYLDRPLVSIRREFNIRVV